MPWISPLVLSEPAKQNSWANSNPNAFNYFSFWALIFGDTFPLPTFQLPQAVIHVVTFNQLIIIYIYES